MSNTINDFRNFFRPDKSVEIFSLCNAIQQAATLVQASLKAHNIELIIDAPTDMQTAGFANEYAQALLNLVTNAKEAILVQGDKGGRISIRLRKVDGLAQVTVTNNGGIIDEKILPRLFEPYFSTKETGTGIGLYMSKMIIENSMSGKISVQNLTDGVEFRIVTPIHVQPK
jgi:signal transduction histidine kinase